MGEIGLGGPGHTVRWRLLRRKGQISILLLNRKGAEGEEAEEQGVVITETNDGSEFDEFVAADKLFGGRRGFQSR